MRGGNWNLETSGHRLPQRHWQHSLTPYRWLRGSQTGEERNKKKKYTVFYLPSYSENSPNQPAIFQRQNTDIQQLTGSRMIQLPLQGCPMTKFHSPFFFNGLFPHKSLPSQAGTKQSSETGLMKHARILFLSQNSEPALIGHSA